MVEAVLKSRDERIQQRSRRWCEQEREMAEIWWLWLRLLSMRKPRFRAWLTGCSIVFKSMVKDGFLSLASCLGRPMTRNLVLDGFSDNRLADIQVETFEKICWRLFNDASKLCGEKDMKNCVSLAYKWWFTDEPEKSELSGVVYMMNRRGPKTEPCGTPQERIVGVDLQLLDLTVKERDSKYLNRSVQCLWCQTIFVDVGVGWCDRLCQRRQTYVKETQTSNILMGHGP